MSKHYVTEHNIVQKLQETGNIYQIIFGFESIHKSQNGNKKRYPHSPNKQLKSIVKKNIANDYAHFPGNCPCRHGKGITQDDAIAGVAIIGAKR